MASGDNRQKGQVRLASVVILVTMPLWLLVSYLGGRFDLPARFAFLSDLAALAAFAFALIVLFRVWRQRRTDGS
ncbi:MAG: DUF5337 family protein [Paracoccaceae bacterium]